MIAAIAVLPAASRPPADPLAALVRGRVAEAPVDCIDPQRVQNGRVIPGLGLAYDTGDRLYLNRLLAGGANRLRADDVLVQPIAGGRLCRIDAITLVDPTTRSRRGFVVLGDFTPYRRHR